MHVGDFDRATDTIAIVRSSYLGTEGATKTRARERVVSLGDVAQEVSRLCGVPDPTEPLLVIAEDTLRDNFTKAQTVLGIRHRSLYQAKHTYAILSLLDGESPSVVARNLGISLATLEKHYAAALQKGRTIAQERSIRSAGTPRKTPRAVSDGLNTRKQKRPRRDLNPSDPLILLRKNGEEVGRMGPEWVHIAHVGKCGFVPFNRFPGAVSSPSRSSQLARDRDGRSTR